MGCLVHLPVKGALDLSIALGRSRQECLLSRVAKPACRGTAPQQSAVQAALLLPQSIDLAPSRISHAAGHAPTAPARRQLAPPAATATATACGGRGAVSAARTHHSAPPENRSPGRRCRRPRSAHAPATVDRAPAALRNRRSTGFGTPCSAGRTTTRLPAIHLRDRT